MLNHFPIDPMVLVIGFSALSLALLAVVIICIVKMNKLYRRYDLFMRGKDAETLEDTIMDLLEEMKELRAKDRASKDAMKLLTKQVHSSFQKFGYVKYNAFKGMGGNLSFALTMLDGNDNGWIFNAMHSREGCYTYIKEIVKGESYIELSEEEQQCLEKAIYQEEYDIKDMKE